MQAPTQPSVSQGFGSVRPSGQFAGQGVQTSIPDPQGNDIPAFVRAKMNQK
jgi:hypothetical protein